MRCREQGKAAVDCQSVLTQPWHQGCAETIRFGCKIEKNGCNCFRNSCFRKGCLAWTDFENVNKYNIQLGKFHWTLTQKSYLLNAAICKSVERFHPI